MINGYQDSSFKPTAYVTRAEAATLIYNALHKQEVGSTDDIITYIVLNHEKDTLEAMQANNVQQLYDLNGRDTTGYYKELSDWSVSKIKSAIDQGFSVKVTMKTDPQVKVNEKSGWSATIQLSEAFEMTFQKGTFSQTTNMDTSNLLYLKSMPDGLKMYDQKSLKNPNIKVGSDFN